MSATDYGFSRDHVKVVTAHGVNLKETADELAGLVSQIMTTPEEECRYQLVGPIQIGLDCRSDLGVVYDLVATMVRKPSLYTRFRWWLFNTKRWIRRGFRPLVKGQWVKIPAEEVRKKCYVKKGRSIFFDHKLLDELLRRCVK